MSLSVPPPTHPSLILRPRPLTSEASTNNNIIILRRGDRRRGVKSLTLQQGVTSRMPKMFCNCNSDGDIMIMKKSRRRPRCSLPATLAITSTIISCYTCNIITAAFVAPTRQAFARHAARDYLIVTSAGREDIPSAGTGTAGGGGAEGTAAAPPPLFDASEFVRGDDEDASSSAVNFEDVEGDYDEVLLSPLDDGRGGGDDADALRFERNALTDDEDRMLTDREDRLFNYVNNTQKVESCVLVGVEDLSAARKARKLSRQRVDEGHDDGVDVGLTWTLEESMVEMRELIQTSGLQLRGEITQRLQEVNPRTYIGTGKVKECQALLDEINGQLERNGEGHCCVCFDLFFRNCFGYHWNHNSPNTQHLIILDGRIRCRVVPGPAEGARECVQ